MGGHPAPGENVLEPLGDVGVLVEPEHRVLSGVPARVRHDRAAAREPVGGIVRRDPVEDLAQQPPEIRGRGVGAPHQGELVLHQRMIDHGQAVHG